MISPSIVLGSVPAGLRDPLIRSFLEIAKNFAEGRWEPAELNGGKFCECVYTILHGSLTGTYASVPSKPTNMFHACVALEQLTATPPRVGDRSLRIQIPRMLLPLYEIRNNRGVGHAGGDVNPNYMDSTSVLAMSSWVLAELIRVFHSVSTVEAQQTVDALVERKHPLVWQVDGIKRVLDPDMPTADQVLLLLHNSPSWVAEADLQLWVEYASLRSFRSRILEPLHTKRLAEYNRTVGCAHITPRGVKDVEERILAEGRKAVMG